MITTRSLALFQAKHQKYSDKVDKTDKSRRTNGHGGHRRSPVERLHETQPN
ncbi:MAG: hypothetical protein LUO95_02160 [Methylococcaceae bacterium]|nr:hypothetical protein [Methylococcaceae bacterium]